MCYYVSVKEKNQLKGLLPGSTIIKDYKSGYFLNGFSHPELPAMCLDNTSMVAPARWGLIPSWARTQDKAEDVANKTLNARSETMFTTPMFRDYAPKNRCLIFVDGFFEWKHEGKSKIPYFIYVKDHRPFAFGGLYSDSNLPSPGIRTCSIITTAANELMSDIHNTKLRMPLILPEEVWSAWLDPGASRKEIEELSVPYQGGDLLAHTIMPLTSLSEDEKNSPSVQHPHEWPKQTLF